MVAGLRFRLRTIMIVIAVLAVLMGSIPALKFYSEICDVSVGIDGSSIRIAIELLPDPAFDPSSGRFIRSHRIYAQIPLKHIAVLVAVVIGFLGLAVYYRSNWRRKVEPGRKLVDEVNPMNRRIARPDLGQSGDAERV